MKRTLGIFFLFLFVFLTTAVAGAAGTYLYEGLLEDTSGNAVANTAVNLEVKIYGNNNTCALWDETQSTTTNATGQFIISVGTGTKLFGPSDFSTIFKNTSTLNCQGSGTWSPVASNGRSFSISASWNGGANAIVSNYIDLSWSPFSTNASYSETSATLVGLPSCVAGQAIRYDGTAWSCVAAVAAETDPTVSAWAKTTPGSGLMDNSGTLQLTNTCATNQVLKWSGTAWACASSVTTETDPTVSAWAKVAPGTGLVNNSGVLQLTNTCATNQVLKWNGTAWACANDSDTVTTGGDLSGTQTAATVVKIQGRTVASTAPGNGQMLTWNGTSSQWEPQAFLAPVTSVAGKGGSVTLNISDISSTVSGAFLSGGSCSAGQALTYSSVTDTMSCSTLSFDAAAIGTGTISNARLPASATYWQSSGGGNINYVSGNVGIGTTTPTATVEVAGTVKATALQGDGNLVTNTGFKNIVTLSSGGGSWAIPTGVKSIRVAIWGAGGGGGAYCKAAFATNQYSAYSGAGGGGGQYVEAIVDTSSGGSLTYSVGAAGTGGGAVGVSGSTGNATTFGPFTANGGGGGTSCGGGGAGGVSALSGANILNLEGGDGASGFNLDTGSLSTLAGSYNRAAGGNGGSAPRGGVGGMGQWNGKGNGKWPGGGGSGGGADAGSPTGFAGGNGAVGGIVIWY